MRGIFFSRQSSHELIIEFEQILAQYYHDVRAITNVIQARRHPVINRNNEQAMAMAAVQAEPRKALCNQNRQQHTRSMTVEY